MIYAKNECIFKVSKIAYKTGELQYFVASKKLQSFYLSSRQKAFQALRELRYRAIIKNSGF